MAVAMSELQPPPSGLPEQRMLIHGVSRNDHVSLREALDPAAQFLPELDFALIAELAMREDEHQALRELRERLPAQ